MKYILEVQYPLPTNYILLIFIYCINFSILSQHLI